MADESDPLAAEIRERLRALAEQHDLDLADVESAARDLIIKLGVAPNEVVGVLADLNKPSPRGPCFVRNPSFP